MVQVIPDCSEIFFFKKPKSLSLSSKSPLVDLSVTSSHNFSSPQAKLLRSTWIFFSHLCLSPLSDVFFMKLTSQSFVSINFFLPYCMYCPSWHTAPICWMFHTFGYVFDMYLKPFHCFYTGKFNLWLIFVPVVYCNMPNLTDQVFLLCTHDVLNFFLQYVEMKYFSHSLVRILPEASKIAMNLFLIKISTSKWSVCLVMLLWCSEKLLTLDTCIISSILLFFFMDVHKMEN